MEIQQSTFVPFSFLDRISENKYYDINMVSNVWLYELINPLPSIYDLQVYFIV